VQRAAEKGGGNVDSKEKETMKLSERLSALKSRGWSCDHPEKSHNCKSHNHGMHQCLYLEGAIGGVPQQIFLSVFSGLVMVIRGEDYPFQDFLNILDGVNVAPVVKPASGQRSLLEDEP
jgi:hypothetical protein